jgi:hypothetical protein
MFQPAPNSSWGQPAKEVDARVLRTFRRLLKRLVVIGEVLNPILMLLLSCITAWLLMFANLENIAFYDGTATTCVLDGSTQGLTHGR